MSNSAKGTSGDKTYFEQQREALINDVAISLEGVLQNINKLNRSLEGVITVGNEFSQVEGLWSQFETVMTHQTESLPTKDSREGPAGDQAQ